jgi:hypothetical protein
MPQTSTTGQLENAAREMISKARYTEEHNAPLMELVEKFTLQRGSDTLIVPKVGQFTINAITEGEDIVDEEDIGMSTISVQPSEVGAKIIITDRLLRQNTQAIWEIVGRQMGDGMARRKDTDIATLFTSLNGGTTLGTAGAPFSSSNATGAIGHAKSNKFGSDLRVAVHPNSMLRLNRDLSTIGSGNIRPIPTGFSATRLEKFWSGIRLSGVPFFEDGNITRDTSDDMIGAIWDKGALGVLTSVGMDKEKQRDASLRATELVVTADYVAFEIDDARGAPLTYDAADPATS